VAGLADLGTDPRFDSLHKRVNNAEELIPLLQSTFAQHPRQHWITALNAQQIPSGPVYSHDDLRQEVHVQEMHLLPTMQHPVAGTIQAVGLPVVFHDSPASIRMPSPMHGQHTEDILREYGYSEEKIQQLKTVGAVRQWQAPAR
jgi:crotonobetainyl-CoA:carnitine CoA-transferase CaiB-like acyl-CoA transferase